MDLMSKQMRQLYLWDIKNIPRSLIIAGWANQFATCHGSAYAVSLPAVKAKLVYFMFYFYNFIIYLL